jgi:hypothetical protein
MLGFVPQPNLRAIAPYELRVDNEHKYSVLAGIRGLYHEH